MSLSPDIVGMTYRYPDHYLVGREEIRQYAAAVKSNDASYLHEEAALALGHAALLAPPTFVVIFGYRAQMAFFAHANIPILEEKMIQAEQGLRILRPIKAGDKLYCDLRIDALRRAFGADVLVLKSRISNQDGDTVQEDFTTLAGRSDAESDPD